MHDTKIISFAQQKGGAGKTTIAAHLGIILRQKGYSVALIDIDPQEILTKWFSQRKADKKLYHTATTIWKLQDELIKLKEHSFDVIIIDTPPHNPMDAHTAIKSADMVLIPVQPSPLDIWSTEQTMDMVFKERVPHRVIWNRSLGDSSMLHPYTHMLRNILSVQVPNHIDIAQSMLYGATVVEKDPACIASQALVSLADEILGLLYSVEILQTHVAEAAS